MSSLSPISAARRVLGSRGARLHVLAGLCVGALLPMTACKSTGGDDVVPARVDLASTISISRAPDAVTPPYWFSQEDEQFLDEVQRGAFNFLWKSSDPARGVATGMVADRTSKPTVSVAGVGFQLSGICVGVERGWITRDQGQRRAELILRSLRDNVTNRKYGLFYHFLNPQNAGQPEDAYEHVVSTIDSAILFAGVLTVSQYFGGEVATIGNQLFDDANWQAFICSPTAKDRKIRGFVSLGWKPNDKSQPQGEGALLPYAWIDNGDEHRLVAFLATCAPKDEHRVRPNLYYQLRRQLGSYSREDADGVMQDTGQMVWFPWSGALFASFFANCWIDYPSIGTDNPALLEVPRRARVDWWENSRRHVLLHQLKALDAKGQFANFGRDAWGLSASDVAGGYAVPGVFPTLSEMPGSIPEVDYTKFEVKDNFGDGTLAPYAAGCAILFDPQRSIAALRNYREFETPPGQPAFWTNPAKGGYGFQDAFNATTGWVAPDSVAIDQGPLLLCIENARTGLLWQIFHSHPYVKAGMERLQLRRELQHSKPRAGTETK